MTAITIKWPEWANFLAFDADGSSTFLSDEPDGAQFGIWQTDGDCEEAIQNEDYFIPTWERFPTSKYFSKEPTP